MFGFTASSVMENPKELVNSILEEEAAGYAAAVMESMEKLTPFDRLGRMRRADGRIINVHYKSMPRLVEETNKQDGSTVKYTVWDGIVFDVTRQVANEERNRTAVQEMMDSSLQPMFEIDTQGCITEWNGAMAEATGFKREHVVGEPVVELMPKEERGKFVSRAPDDESKSQWDCVLVTKDDKIMYLHAACTTIRDANGSYNGQLFCCQDVTAIREAEKQKTAALELVDAERGLTEWLSHEIRNPLSVAMEAAMTLKEGGDDAMSCIDLICESIRYIVDLLTNMLDLNKCLDGKIALYPAPCRLREEILVPTYKMMRVRNNQVDLQLVGAEEIEAVVDKLRLRQVITNLVSNALKFTSTGYVRISLQQQPLGPNNKKKTVRIAVSDSGCGVKPSDYDALFSKWEQLGSKMNGTGIGLCLSKALVMAMGGRIFLDESYSSDIEGQPVRYECSALFEYTFLKLTISFRQGAQFIVDLPIAPMLGLDNETNRMPAFESLSAAVVASRGSGRLDSEPAKELRSADLYIAVDNTRIPKATDTFVKGHFKLLMIDDEKMGRKLLRKRFSRLFPDAEIDEVASGEEAVIATEKKNYDIITVDHFMAIDEMSGEETIRALRNRGVDALIVGISGNSKEKEHLQAGAQDFFQKPIPSDEVIIKRLIPKLSPPCDWKVLCVDDIKVNTRFLCRRLRKVAAPHFTSTDAAEKVNLQLIYT